MINVEATNKIQPVIQVTASHYDFEKYLTKERWASYREQIRLTFAANPETVLYIGVGDNIVPTILELYGIRVTRFDFDDRLGVDISGDVRDLAALLRGERYDVILCCQVLEHVPFVDFARSMSGLLQATTRKLVISLPYCHKHLGGFSFQLPKIRKISFDFWVPCFWRDWKFDGEHYWEVGAKGYSLSKITNEILRVAIVANRFFVSGYHYHVFFELEPLVRSD